MLLLLVVLIGLGVARVKVNVVGVGLRVVRIGDHGLWGRGENKVDIIFWAKVGGFLFVVVVVVVARDLTPGLEGIFRVHVPLNLTDKMIEKKKR